MEMKLLGKIRYLLIAVALAGGTIAATKSARAAENPDRGSLKKVGDVVWIDRHMLPDGTGAVEGCP
jgi:hypothetical protein